MSEEVCQLLQRLAFPMASRGPSLHCLYSGKKTPKKNCHISQYPLFQKSRTNIFPNLHWFIAFFFCSGINHLEWESYSSRGRYRQVLHSDNISEKRLRSRGPATTCTAGDSTRRPADGRAPGAPCRSWWRSPGPPGGPWSDTGLLVWPRGSAPTTGCRAPRPS